MTTTGGIELNQIFTLNMITKSKIKRGPTDLTEELCWDMRGQLVLALGIIIRSWNEALFFSLINQMMIIGDKR